MAFSAFSYVSLSIIVGLITCGDPANAQRSPTISYISQEQIKDIGGTVELVCSVQYSGEYPVLWLKPDNQGGASVTISHKSSMILHDSRFSLRFDATSATYTLQIKDIQETDAGIYICQILLSTTNKINAEVQLQVRRPPIISDNSTLSSIVTEGQAVNLECWASGFPVPTITWRRENNAVLPMGTSIYRGNVLEIKNIRKEDRGTYFCVADNSVGRATRRNVNVEVEFAPVITVPQPRLGQALQYDMDLKCHIVAYPLPSVLWIKDGIQLSNNQHYEISYSTSADQFTESILRVITVEKRQYGEYTCKAVNKLGTSEGRVELFESIIPVCPPACGKSHYGEASRITHSTVALVAAFVAVLFRNVDSRH